MPKCLLILLLTYKFVAEINGDKIKGKYSQKAGEYHQLTVPKKISDNGEFMSNYIPHFYDGSRKKRDLQGETVNYLVNIDNQDHHVQLWPNLNFIAPGLVIEHHTKDSHNNVSNIAMRQTNARRCYFNGIIKGMPNSRAMLSTCDGLAGVITTANKESYLIEPIHDDDGGGEHVHLIHKRSLGQWNDANDPSLTNCGTKGKFQNAFQERLKWENVYGERLEKSLKNSLVDSFSPINVRNKRGYDIRSDEFKVDCAERDYKLCIPCESTTLAEVYPPNDPVCETKPPLYLEVMLVIDSRVDKSCLGFDEESYMYTIMNMVSTNLEDATIGTPIKLSIVRIIFLTFLYPLLDILRYSPMKLLNNFCAWQMNFNPPGEEHPNHHDLAIFVTKFEPCQGHILGLSNVASLCRPDRACIVASDEGLLLANIITHQIGHSLGAEHDDASSGACASEEPDGTRYHMGPVISTSSSEWSVCSKHSFTEFLATHAAWCMMDIPTVHDFIWPNILPGQIYTPIQQCTLRFNMKTVACRVGEFCKNMFCQISATQCASFGDPPAQGTPCAMDMWCFNGKCVHRGARPGSISGEWGLWTHWSVCTRSCGGGVQTRHRSCNNPAPSQGGRYCIGDYLSFRMCGLNPCLGYTESFANLQCKLTDKRAYKGRYNSWTHFQPYFQVVECSLVCVNELKQVAIRSPVALDGTPCRYMRNDVCVQGKCLRVGCDNVISSKSKEDACGLCHGNGTECEVVHGTFDETIVSRDLVPFLKLPTGTSMIFIKELNPSACIFLITSSVNESFYLNSLRGETTLPGVINVAGTNGVYEKKSNVELLFIKGPLQEPITVHLLCKDCKESGISYQYALPHYDKYYIPKYNWVYLHWDECNLPCGGGIQKARPVCVEARSGEVEDKYCSLHKIPQVFVQGCNRFPCTARWWTGPWSNCECTNNEGIQTRLVLCLQSQGLLTLRSKVVKEKECHKQPKPRLERPCSIEKCDGPVTIQTPFCLGRQRRHLKGKVSPPPIVKEERYPEIIKKSREENLLRKREKLYLAMKEKLKDESDIDDVIANKLYQYRAGHKPKLFSSSLDMAHPSDKEVKVNIDKNNLIMEPSNIMDRYLLTKMSKMAHSMKPHAVAVTTNSSVMFARPIASYGQNYKQVMWHASTDPITQQIFTQKINKMSSTINPMFQMNSHQQSVAPTSTKMWLPSTSVCTTKHTTAGVTVRTTKVEHADTWCPIRCQSSKAATCQNDVCPPLNVSRVEELPRVDMIKGPAYKIWLAPIIQRKCGFVDTDTELKLLGSAARWPLGNRSNLVTITGENARQILREAKSLASTPPVIDNNLYYN